MLFSANDPKESVSVLSGAEQGPMLFGKVMMATPIILEIKGGVVTDFHGSYDNDLAIKGVES